MHAVLAGLGSPLAQTADAVGHDSALGASPVPAIPMAFQGHGGVSRYSFRV